MSSSSIFSGLKSSLPLLMPSVDAESGTGQDVTIRFLAAEGLPKMDLLSSTDPYFIAKIDDQVSYTSRILGDTSSPTWDSEEWVVRNIPMNAKLTVALYDKDNNILNDDFIGQFEISNLSSYHAPPEGHPIISSSGRPSGSFHLTIQSRKVSESGEKLPRYTYDGACQYTRHESATFGRLATSNSDEGYTTWKIQLRRIPVFFRPLDLQPWNRTYPIAQEIFSGTILSVAKQNSFKLAHKILYGRTINKNECGYLTSAKDLWEKILTDEATRSIRLCIYTYVIDDNTWKFSQTGTQYFTDFASKHALHANCAEYVRYAGQFHPRPKFGWDRCDDEWELVFDNWSGTYSPALDLLTKLKELLQFNFPGLNVATYHFTDPLLSASMEEMKAAAEKPKTSSHTLNQLILNQKVSEMESTVKTVKNL